MGLPCLFLLSLESLHWGWMSETHHFMYFVMFFRDPILSTRENLKLITYTNFDFLDSIFSACLFTSNQMLGFHQIQDILNGNPGFGWKKEQEINKVKEKLLYWVPSTCMACYKNQANSFSETSEFLCEREGTQFLLLFASSFIYFPSFLKKYFPNKTAMSAAWKFCVSVILSLWLQASWGFLLNNSALIWEKTIKLLAVST